MNEQVLRLAQLKSTCEVKLQETRKGRKRAVNALAAVKKQVISLKNSLKLVNSKHKKTKEQLSSANAMLAEQAAQNATRIHTEKALEKEVQRKQTEVRAPSAKNREEAKLRKEAVKKMAAAGLREKRAKAKLSSVQSGRTSGKQVPVSQLKDKGQRKKRLNECAQRVFEDAVKRAEREKVDVVKNLTLEFEGFRPMKLHFVDPEEEEMEEEMENGMPTLDNDLKSSLDSMLALANKKFLSKTTMKELKIENLKDLDKRKKEMESELAEKLGLKCDDGRADFSMKKCAHEVHRLRNIGKLCKDKKIEILIAGDGRSVRTKHKSLAMHLIFLDEGSKVHKHTHVHQLGMCDCKEDNAEMRQACSRCIKEINELASETIDGNTVELHLGGDMKFTLMCCGLHPAGTKKRGTCTHCNCSETTRRKNHCCHRINEDRLVSAKSKNMCGCGFGFGV